MNKESFILGIRRLPFNAVMRKRRQELGLFQEQLADKVGLKPHFIAQVEGLRRYPSQEQAQKIAEGLGLEIDEIFPKWTSGMIIPYRKDLTQYIEVENLRLDNQEVLELTTGEDKELERSIDRDFLKERMNKILTKELTPRERQVLTFRLGLDGKGERTLSQTGREFGVTRERIRQIEARALRRIKRSSKELQDFL